MLKEQQEQLISTLAMREQYRDQYSLEKDPIYKDRLLWRAQTFRHMVHLLPGQTILELGAGKGFFTCQLYNASRGENPITAVRFTSEKLREDTLPNSVAFHQATSLPGEIIGRQFDYIVALDLLDERNCGWLLQVVYNFLKPGGEVVFSESNPWNVVLKIRRSASRFFGKKDSRKLLSRPELYELISEIGFLKVFAVHNDFVYPPLTKSLVWLLRNLSIVLENTPKIQTLAGNILIHAQKPPRSVVWPDISLCEHTKLHRSVSVVIPCHNEEMNIGPLIAGIKKLFGEYIHEIIPVDDNSQDSTADLLRNMAALDPIIKPFFRSPPNGVGRAIADGYRAATGDYVLSMDCDFQHLLPEIRDLFDAVAEGYDVAVGSRFSRHSVLLNYPIQKIIANRGFHLLAQIMLFRHFRDLTNNLKLMRKEVVQKLQLTQPGFAVNAETGIQPLLMGYSLKEVPISWINRTPDMGVSSFDLVKVGGGYWKVLYRLWIKKILGYYSGRQEISDSYSRRAENCEDSGRDKGIKDATLEMEEQVCDLDTIADPTPNNKRHIESRIQPDRSAKVFVWGVWVFMLAVALVSLVKYGKNIPFSEDWLLVPPLTGNEPSLVDWLWAQHNEHRVPLGRIILLLLLKASNGDFRVGMFFNVVVIGVFAFLLIRCARYIRGGQTNYSDAFFPIALLHLGNWENLFWSWQLTQVVPIILSGLVLLIIVKNSIFKSRSAAATFGLCLILLPLCGANGLILVPFLALWSIYSGFFLKHEKDKNDVKRWNYKVLIGSAAVAITLMGLYFVGYQSFSYNASQPGLLTAVYAAGQFLSLSFGPISRNSWGPAIFTIICILAISGIAAIFGVITHAGKQRLRSLGVLLFFANLVLFSCAVGWGRAEVLDLPDWGGVWPARYSLIAVPFLITAYFIWELYSPKKLRMTCQNILFIGMCLLIPFNTFHGLKWYDWYLEGVGPFERDLKAGMTHTALVERNNEFLYRWMDPSFNKVTMLKEKDIGLFALIKEDKTPSNDISKNESSTKANQIKSHSNNFSAEQLVASVIRYYTHEAKEVYFVWGIDGWQVLPEKLRPTETMIKNSVMHTRMRKSEDFFVARIHAPAGFKIDYGFLITKTHNSFDITWPVWDEGDKNNPILLSKDGRTDVNATLNFSLETREIRYSLPDANKVFFVWGLNGWHVAPEELRPKGTQVINKVMHTPMAQKAGDFVVHIRVPVGTKINYGFKITERKGWFDIGDPVWDGDHQFQMKLSDEDAFKITGKVSLDGNSSKINFGLILLFGIAVAFGIGLIVHKISYRYNKGYKST